MACEDTVILTSLIGHKFISSRLKSNPTTAYKSRFLLEKSDLRHVLNMPIQPLETFETSLFEWGIDSEDFLLSFTPPAFRHYFSKNDKTLVFSL